MAYTATLYHPGRPPRPLTGPELASLDLFVNANRRGNYLTARPRSVEKLLGVAHADTLYTDTTVGVWGQANAADYDNAKANPEAEEAVAGLSPELVELVGPILIVITED